MSKVKQKPYDTLIRSRIDTKAQRDFSKPRFCFATEVDLDRMGGAVTDDRKVLSCLNEIGVVDLIYLQKKRYRSMWVALFVFTLSILRSFSKPYRMYISRGLVTTTILMTCKIFLGKDKKVAHKTPIPFPSKEAGYLRFTRLEFLARYVVFRFLEKVAMSNVDAIIVPSASYAAELVQNGVNKSKVFVIPYYIEEGFFEQPIKRDVNGIFTFAYVGGFHPYHDLAPLIEGFEIFARKHEKVTLLLAGDGIMRSQIEKMVEERKLENKITFRGRIPHSSVAAFLSEANAFVYMARTAGMSTSLLEAAAAGKPIITLRKQGDSSLASYFRHGKEIFMVSNLSPREIARALGMVFTDSQLRISVSEGARKVALEHFNRKATLRELERMIHAVVTD